jgi:hypothetical protein
MQLADDRQVARAVCGFSLLLDQLFDDWEATAAHAACPTCLGDRVLGASTRLDGSSNRTVTNPATMTDDHKAYRSGAVPFEYSGVMLKINVNINRVSICAAIELTYGACQHL